MRLLLVEHNISVGEELRAALRQDAYQVDWLKDAGQAANVITHSEFAVIILSLDQKNPDNIVLLNQLRRKKNVTPVLVLEDTALLNNKIQVLDAGADDCLEKPFAVPELKARIRALMRRNYGQAASTLEFQGLKIDTQCRQVWYEDTLVDLSRREYALLMGLLARPGHVLSREKLADSLYGWETDIESNSIEVHIHQLRKKLYPGLIKTVRGMGYSVVSP